MCWPLQQNARVIKCCKYPINTTQLFRVVNPNLPHCTKDVWFRTSFPCHLEEGGSCWLMVRWWRGEVVREAVVSINYPELSTLKLSTAALPFSLAAPFLPSTKKPSRGSRGLNQKGCFLLLFVLHVPGLLLHDMWALSHFSCEGQVSLLSPGI